MKTITALATLAFASCTGHRPPDFDVSPTLQKQVVRGVFAALDDHYVFPERLPAYRAQLLARWETADFGRLDRAHKLVDRMNQDFHEVVNDGHLSLRLAAAFPDEAFGDPGAIDPATLAKLEELDRKSGFGIGKVEVHEGNIGYLELQAFANKSPGQSAAYASAMAKLKDTRALILDLRRNGGGDGDAVADLAGYLLDHKTLLQYDVPRHGEPLEHFSAEAVAGPRYGEERPVYVLTSRDTYSAAEECAYDLQTRKRATVVGDRSGGGANHNRLVRIAGKFALSVPYMTTRNAVTGTNWEGTGVQPDVKVAPGDALAAAERLAREAAARRERTEGSAKGG